MKFLIYLISGTLGLGVAPMSTPIDKAIFAPLSSVDSSLQVCVDQRSNKPLTGDIELMLVMDNSLSLRDNDPDGKRFSQVRTMLRSVHERISGSRNPRNVRFSFVTFANRSVVNIPLRNAIVLDDGNLETIAKRVESAAPGDQQNTDYVAALDTALDQMELAETQNCRVVVWFTDGAYWPSVGAVGDTKTGGSLRDKVCQVGGFSTRMRELNINLFPLYIEPKIRTSGDERKDDPTASRDVMAHLTGDQSAFGEDPYQGGSPCSAIPSHIGEVLSAADVNQLGQFFADLPNIIEGGQPVACPTKNGRVESRQLPAGRYVSEISIVKYAVKGKELAPQDLLARQPNGETTPLDQYFKGKDGRYAATDAARELQSGWVIEGSGEEHCIRAFPREALAAQIRKSGGATSLQPIGSAMEWLEGEDLVSTLADRDVPVVRLGPSSSCDPLFNGFTTDLEGLESAFSSFSGRGRGVICVDPPGSRVFARGISLDVTRDGEPLIVCDDIKIRRVGDDQFIEADRTESSTECVIDFKGSGTSFLGISSQFPTGLLTEAQGESCNVDLSKSKVNAKNEGELVAIVVLAVLKENRKTKCSVSGKNLTFDYQDANGKRSSGEIPFSIVLNLQPEPNRIAALIATLLTVAALLAAALVILRRMTIDAAALVGPYKMFAVRFGVLASRAVDGRVSMIVDSRQLREMRIDMDRVDRAQLDGSESKLIASDQSDELTIKREIPPLRFMLREPWAWIDDSRKYVVHPQGRRAPANQNLTAPFREAIVALDDGPIAGAENQRAISLWVIRQRGASEGDQIAVEEFLKEYAGVLVNELMQEINAGTNDEVDGPAKGAVPAPPPPETGESGLQNRVDVPLPPDWV